MDTQNATLRRAALLSSLSEEVRSALLDRAWCTIIRRRDFIYVPGDAGDAVFVVLRGCVRLLLLSDDGREATLDLREAGDVFGEEALATGATRSTAAQAWEETQLVAVPVEELRAALAGESEAVWALAALIGERCRSAEALLDGLAFRDVGRLARCLLQLAERLGVPRPDGTVTLRARLTHQDLATLVCTTRETVTLTLEKFKQEGWIAVQGRSIVLRDLLALRERAGGSASELK